MFVGYIEWILLFFTAWSLALLDNKLIMAVTFFGAHEKIQLSIIHTIKIFTSLFHNIWPMNNHNCPYVLLDKIYYAHKIIL